MTRAKCSYLTYRNVVPVNSLWAGLGRSLTSRHGPRGFALFASFAIEPRRAALLLELTASFSEPCWCGLSDQAAARAVAGPSAPSNSAATALGSLACSLLANPGSP